MFSQPQIKNTLESRFGVGRPTVLNCVRIETGITNQAQIRELQHPQESQSRAATDCT